MASSFTGLRLLDGSSAAKELDLASELFHRINRIVPQDQQVLTVGPKELVRNAVASMRAHGYSQLPVVENGEVLGVFSYRSFAQEAAAGTLDDWNRWRCAPGDLTVDEFMEQFDFARVTEEMSRVFEAMDRDNGILVGTPERLIGVLTPMDFLRYLHQVASPFVMISEIELALRALVRLALTPEKFILMAKRCLSSAYHGEDNVPISLEEMTFDNYQILISHSANWAEFFESLFGGTRARTSGKLKEIGGLRNDLFHFKREITLQDHQTLAGHRNWLLNKVKQIGASRRTEMQR